MKDRQAKLSTRSLAAMAFLVFGLMAPTLHAWDHPSHMTSAAIAFAEIEQARPELIKKIGLIYYRGW